MKRLAVLAAVACLCGGALPGTGRAGFLGQSVDVSLQAPIGSVVTDLGTQTIAAGGTLFSDSAGDQITVGDTSIQISYPLAFLPHPFAGFAISEVGASPDTIAGVSLGTTNITGFDSSRLTFDGTDVFVNLQGIDTAGGTNTLTVDVSFAPTTATPEPASLTLLGLGVAGMAGYGWRRRASA